MICCLRNLTPKFLPDSIAHIKFSASVGCALFAYANCFNNS